MTVTSPDDSAADFAAGQRHVRVEGVRLRFAAAHMATLGAKLEPLHGHNYIVAVRVDGPLTSDHWVIDFSALKRLARDACEALDHRFLLQRHSPELAIEELPDRWVVRHGERRYEFPASDVAVLPIANSTAELLAEWIARRIAAGLPGAGYADLRRIAVEVEEMPGQSGGWASDLPLPHPTAAPGEPPR